MKTKIYKAMKMMLILLIMTIIEITNWKVSANFPNNLGTIIKSGNVAAPAGFYDSAGQSLKYDPTNKFIVFCSTYSHHFYANGCTLSDDWSEALRAGVAKIIEKANITNNPITAGQYISDNTLLNKNLQVSLAISALIYKKEDPNKVYWISGYYDPQTYLNDEFKQILRQAEAEYDRIDAKNYSVSITKIKNDGSYNPLDASSNPEFIYHIEGSNIDNLKLTLEIYNSTIPDNMKLKLSFSEQENFNTVLDSKDVTQNDITQNNNKPLTINTSTAVKDLKDLYLKVELEDNRNDKSTTPTIRFHINAKGNFNYNIARNYYCGTNKQTLTPNKIESQTESKNAYVNGKISSVSIPDYPNLKITKVEKNNTNKKIGNTRLKIIRKNTDSDSAEETSQTVYTDSNGEYVLSDLDDGEYCVQETKAGSGYKLDKTEHCFTISMNTSQSNQINVTTNDSAINYNDSDLITIILENEKNTMKITKVDEDNNPVSGATLKITKVGTADDAWQLPNNESKEWVTTNNPKEFTGLEKGKYYIYETKTPDGYILNEKPVLLEVTGYETVEKTVKFTNKKTNIMIGKLDENKYKLAGAQLNITDKDGNIVYGPWTSKKNEYENLNGILNINTVYFLNEVDPPKGYAQADPIKFKLNDVGEVILLDKNDQPIEDSVEQESKNTIELTNEKNTVSISKTDITGTNEVEGAHLQIINRNNGEIIKLKEVEDGILEPNVNGDEYWVSTKTPKIIRKLGEGSYTLKEIQAPEGYVLSEETIDFTVDSKGKVKVDDKYVDSKTLIMTNDHIKVYISKQDITTKEELPGAHLTVTDENGNVVEGGDWVSTNEPHLLEELVPGTYTITEVTSPDGYTKNEESVTFTIDKDGKISGNTVMYNTPTPEVPSTLSTQSIVIIVLGTILVCTGVGLYFYGLKKKKEN